MTRRTVFRAWKSCTWAKQLLVYFEFISTVNLVTDISPLCFGCQEAQSPKSDFSNSKYKAANSLLRRTPWKLEGSEAPWGVVAGNLDLKKQAKEEMGQVFGKGGKKPMRRGLETERGGDHRRKWVPENPPKVISTHAEGLPRWSSGYGASLPAQGAQVQSWTKN